MKTILLVISIMISINTIANAGECKFSIDAKTEKKYSISKFLVDNGYRVGSSRAKSDYHIVASIEDASLTYYTRSWTRGSTHFVAPKVEFYDTRKDKHLFSHTGERRKVLMFRKYRVRELLQDLVGKFDFYQFSCD